MRIVMDVGGGGGPLVGLRGAYRYGCERGWRALSGHYSVEGLGQLILKNTPSALSSL